MNILDIAKTCHQVNRALCVAFGDNSQPVWEEAPEWQRNSAVKGVELHLVNPGASPSAAHEAWLKTKREDGWKYGPVKDAVKKEHPCFVEYDDLPPDQKAKDYLFISVVDSLREHLQKEGNTGPQGAMGTSGSCKAGIKFSRKGAQRFPKKRAKRT